MDLGFDEWELAKDSFCPSMVLLALSSRGKSFFANWRKIDYLA